MILDELKEENDPEFYKKRFNEASNYCMRMIQATHKGHYTKPKDPWSHVGYLDVVSENCAEYIRTIKGLNKVFIVVMAVQFIIILYILSKYVI